MVRLPSEYQEVEWISTDANSTANAYINTGVQTSEDLRFTVDFQANRVNGRYIMGCYHNDDASFYLYYGAGVTFQTAFGTKWANTSLKSDSDRHKLIYEFANGYLNVTHNGDAILTKQADFSTPQTIYVVGVVDKEKTSSKTYSVTMSKNGTLIQNLIPCYRLSDQEPGMYDTVTNTFFTNSGTGTFLVGNDVNYSTVNLMESRRRILLNTPHIKSLSGNALSFRTDVPYTLKECKIHFTPKQEGTGTPSPENVRPITGWDGITITHNDITTTIPFPRTIYGGYVDLVKGEVVEEWVKTTIGSDWVLQNSTLSVFQKIISGKKPTTVDSELISDSYGIHTTIPVTQLNQLPDLNICGRQTYNRIFLRDTRFANVEDFESAMSSSEFCYTLVTPNTYLLTDPPSIPSTLRGMNNIISNANGEISVSFYSH